jgi:acetyl esterase/lipase
LNASSDSRNNFLEQAVSNSMNLLAIAVISGALWCVPASLRAAERVPEVVKIWPAAAPGSASWTQQELEESVPLPGPDHLTARRVRNVVTPTLTVYRPPAGKGNGTAVIVCPGGGFFGLMMNYEGSDPAEWLAARGVTAFVLKYRLLRTSPDIAADAAEQTELFSALQKDFDTSIHRLDAGRAVAIADGQQAIRYVREHAGQWHIAADRIGLMGFSAGAGLTMGVVLDHDESSRPNFAVSLYGYMDDREVMKDAPPTFIVATQADGLVPSERSIRIYQRLTAAKVPAELHLFEQGPHGFGFRKLGLPVDHWPESLERWMTSRGLMPAP